MKKNKNKRFTNLLLAMLSFVFMVFAVGLVGCGSTSDPSNSESQEDPTVTAMYNYTIENDEVTIESLKSSVDLTTLTELIIPNTIEGYPVVKLGAGSLWASTRTNIAITSITLSENLSEIPSLLGAGRAMFPNMTKLTSIYFNCKNLKICDIESTKDIVGSEIFDNAGTDADGITVYVGANVEVLPSNLFTNSLVATSDVTPKITSVVFAENSKCTTIGSACFYFSGSSDHTLNATYLKSINLPDSLTTIEAYAFYGCTELENITIPVNVTTIEDYAFSGCTGLNTITYNAKDLSGRDLEEIYCPFASSSAETLVIGSSVEKIPAYFSNLFNTSNSSTSVHFTNVEFPSDGGSLTEIGDYAFYSLYVTAPDVNISKVTKIGTYGMFFSDGINDLYLGSCLQSSGAYAFSSGNYSSVSGNVYYSGTVDDWCQIEFASSSANPISSGYADLVIGGKVVGGYIDEDNKDNYVITITTTSIGDYAFYHYRTDSSDYEDYGIVDYGFDLDLRSVNYIGYNAFYHSNIMSNIKFIGTWYNGSSNVEIYDSDLKNPSGDGTFTRVSE